MSTVLSKPVNSQKAKSQSDYISSLRGLLEQKRSSLEWLVIAHHDQSMLRQLADVIDDRSAAVLQIPQGAWDFRNSELADAVRWSLEQANTSHLLLVGHSDGVPRQQLANSIGGGLNVVGENESLRSSYSRILEGATSAHMQIEQAKNRFIEQVDSLCEIAEVQHAVAAGRLHLHTLFYISQSATFSVFNLATQEFVPLTA